MVIRAFSQKHISRKNEMFIKGKFSVAASIPWKYEKRKSLKGSTSATLYWFALTLSFHVLPSEIHSSTSSPAKNESNRLILVLFTYYKFFISGSRWG